MKRAASALFLAVLFGGLVYLAGFPWTMAMIFGGAIGLIVYVGDGK